MHLDVYPNPASGTVTVAMNEVDLATAYCYNLSGKKVREWSVAGPLQTIDLDGIASGVYLLRFRTASGWLPGAQRLVVE